MMAQVFPTQIYVCRLCALKCMVPGLLIFSPEGLQHGLLQKMQEVLQITLNEIDRFPKIVCGDCVYKLDTSYEFKNKCWASQHYLNEYYRHYEVGTDLTMKNTIQNTEFRCLDLSDGLNDEPTIQDLEHLVNETNSPNNESYRSNEITEYQIQQIERNIEGETQKDSMSLPDITMYSFDTISEASAVDQQDLLSNVSELEVPAISPPNPDAIVETATDDIVEPVNPIIANETIETNNGKSTTLKKQCAQCNKTFNTNYKLKEHQRTHRDEKPLVCQNGCNKRFRSKIGLIQHEANHTGNFSLFCPICRKGFEIKSYLTIHMRTHNTEKIFKCSMPMCDLRFKAKQALIDHENRHLGLKPYKCDICQKRFITKSLCISHLQTHSNDAPHKHQCTTCSKFFTTKSSLTIHMKIHSDDRKHVCEFCGKAFLAKTDLKLHEIIHSGDKNWMCDICAKTFTRNVELTRHKRTHTGDKPYKCKFFQCKKSFVQSSTLQIHMRLHTGERPFPCDRPMCSYKSASRTHLQRHLQSHNRKADKLVNKIKLFGKSGEKCAIQAKS